MFRWTAPAVEGLTTGSFFLSAPLKRQRKTHRLGRARKSTPEPAATRSGRARKSTERGTTAGAPCAGTTAAAPCAGWQPLHQTRWQPQQAVARRSSGLARSRTLHVGLVIGIIWAGRTSAGAVVSGVMWCWPGRDAAAARRAFDEHPWQTDIQKEKSMER